MIQSVCFRVFLLAFVLLLKSSNSLERIYEIMFAHTKLICFVLHLLLFSFQRSMRPADPALPVRIPSVPLCAFSSRQPIYYTTFRSVCQGVFEKFFEVFSNLFPFSPHRPFFSGIRTPLPERLIIIPPFSPFVKWVSKSFLKFFRFFSWHPWFERSIQRPFCGSFDSIPLFPPFVNPFLQISFSFCMIFSFSAKTIGTRR